MAKVNEFDLKTFQSEVFRDFKGLQLNAAFANIDLKRLDKADGSFSPTGLFARAFLTAFRWLGRRGQKSTKSKPGFDEKDARAAEITSDPKIKKLLCPRLCAEILPDLPTEAMRARIVNVVTFALLDTKVAEEFSIEKDVRLFSLIILGVWQRGIDTYCSRKGR